MRKLAIGYLLFISSTAYGEDSLQRRNELIDAYVNSTSEDSRLLVLGDNDIRPNAMTMSNSVTKQEHNKQHINFNIYHLIGGYVGYVDWDCTLNDYPMEPLSNRKGIFKYIYDEDMCPVPNALQMAGDPKSDIKVKAWGQNLLASLHDLLVPHGYFLELLQSCGGINVSRKDRFISNSGLFKHVSDPSVRLNILTAKLPLKHQVGEPVWKSLITPIPTSKTLHKTCALWNLAVDLAGRDSNLTEKFYAKPSTVIRKVRFLISQSTPRDLASSLHMLAKDSLDCVLYRRVYYTIKPDSVIDLPVWKEIVNYATDRHWDKPSQHLTYSDDEEELSGYEHSDHYPSNELRNWIYRYDDALPMGCHVLDVDSENYKFLASVCNTTPAVNDVQPKGLMEIYERL